MREILFRGKRIDNGEWVEGGYYREDYTNYVYITFWNSFGLGFMDSCRVDPATVGQYTGLTDMKGKRIFEGDIVDNEYDAGDIQRFKVVFSELYLCWLAVNKYGAYGKLASTIGTLEVIGNIHDHPELLKGD